MIRALAAALALALAALAPARARADELAPSEIVFVYVEGNVGGASGGHSALVFGEETYDFEVAPHGTMRLRRAPWSTTRFKYSVLHNRPVHTAAVPVAPGDLKRARDHFARELLLQDAALDAVRERERDVALLEARLGLRDGWELPGAGLVDPGRTGEPSALALRERIERELGPGFLADALARAEAAFAEQAAIDPARARELLAEREALRALADADAVADDASLALDLPPVADTERPALEHLADRTAASVLELLRSPRSDRAGPLLLAAARHQLLRRSLAEGRLLLLGAMPDEAPPALDAHAAALRGAELEGMARRQRERLLAARREVLALREPEEAQYNLLESLASRASEYERGARENRPVREPDGRLVPSRARRVALAPAPPDARPALRSALAAAQAAARDAERALERRYPYDILTRNCATELVQQLEDAYGGREGLRAALGGSLEPGEGLSFIPFVLQDLVESRLPVARRERIPSYRERALDALRAERAGAFALAREASPFTAQVYRWRDRDTRFALFTSDVFWPRPLYGFVNLASALPDTLLGIATAPFDGGRRVRRGAWGALYSLPELAFFNIRKGTFDAGTLPPEVTPEADAAAVAGR